MASRRTIVLIGLAALAVVAAILWIPWATEKRGVIAATPVPPPIFSYTPAPVKGGSRACLRTVTFDQQTQIGEMALATGGKPGPPLAITASAPGYHATAQIPAGYLDDNAARFELSASPKHAVIGQLCVRNTGKQTVILNSTTEYHTNGRPTLFVDGGEQPMDPKLIFYARTAGSYLSRAGQILRHAATFTPQFFSRWVLAALGLFALAGIPVAIAIAFARADAADWEND